MEIRVKWIEVLWGMLNGGPLDLMIETTGLLNPAAPIYYNVILLNKFY